MKKKNSSGSRKRAVDIIYLDFSKVFSTFSYYILVDKLVRYILDRKATRQMEIWLKF